MLDNDLKKIINELINQIKNYWGNNVSIIDIITHEGAPFDLFEISTLLYNKFNVLFEYEKSTVGINIKIGNEYIGLSRLSNIPVIKGFKSNIPENLLHNFKALDEVLKSI